MAHFNKKKFPASSVVIVLLDIFIWIFIALFLLAIIGVGTVAGYFGGGIGTFPSIVIIILVGALYILPFLLIKEMLRAFLATEKNTADTADILRKHFGVSEAPEAPALAPEQAPEAPAPAPEQTPK